MKKKHYLAVKKLNALSKKGLNIVENIISTALNCLEMEIHLKTINVSRFHNQNLSQFHNQQDSSFLLTLYLHCSK